MLFFKCKKCHCICIGIQQIPLAIKVGANICYRRYLGDSRICHHVCIDTAFMKRFTRNLHNGGSCCADAVNNRIRYANHRQVFPLLFIFRIIHKQRVKVCPYTLHVLTAKNHTPGITFRPPCHG